MPAMEAAAPPAGPLPLPGKGDCHADPWACGRWQVAGGRQWPGPTAAGGQGGALPVPSSQEVRWGGTEAERSPAPAGAHQAYWRVGSEGGKWSALQPLKLIYWLIRRFPPPPAGGWEREGGAHGAAGAAGRPAGARVWQCLPSREHHMAKAGCKGLGSGKGPGTLKPMRPEHLNGALLRKGPRSPEVRVWGAVGWADPDPERTK